MSEESSIVSNDETYSDIAGLDFLSVSGFDDEIISCPDHENIPNYLKCAYMQVKKSNNELLSDINSQLGRYKYVSKAEKIRKFKYPCKFTDMNGRACTSYTNNNTHLCAVHESRSYSVCKLQCIYDSNDLNAITSNTGRCDGRTLSSYGLCKRHANCTYYRERQLYEADWIRYMMMRQPLYILRHYCLINFDNEKKEYIRIKKFKNLQDSAKSIAHDLGIYDTLINNCDGGFITKEIAEDIFEVKPGEDATECE
jgi:hypothetical protein